MRTIKPYVKHFGSRARDLPVRGDVDFPGRVVALTKPHFDAVLIEDFVSRAPPCRWLRRLARRQRRLAATSGTVGGGLRQTRRRLRQPHRLCQHALCWACGARQRVPGRVMRIWLLSNLHLEHEAWHPPADVSADVSADVLVLAGDIARGPQALHWIQRWREILPPRIVCVAGNREGYRRVWAHVIRQLRAARAPGLHSLENRAVIFDGLRFLGATLWADFELFRGPNPVLERAAYPLSGGQRENPRFDSRLVLEVA